jgi:PPIC-type PPIASE domain
MHRSLFVLTCVITLAGLAAAQKRGSLPSSSGTDRAARSSQAAKNASPATATIGNAMNAAASSQSSPATAAFAEIPPDAAVITLHGLCSSGTAQTQDATACETTISREQFETVLDAVSLGGQVFAPGAIRTVADTYTQNFVLSEAALKSGIDKDPRVQQLLELTRRRTLAEAYRRAVEEKHRNPSAAELQSYYHAHISQYEAVKAERLFIPKFNPKSPKDQDFEKNAQSLAQELRARAQKGEPMDKLQNEAFLKLGIPAPSFLPDNGLRRRASYPAPIEKDVFALKPGEVTRIENETGGFTFYRLTARDTYSLDQVKGEIVRDLFRQKMEEEMRATLQPVKIEMNDHYFAPAATPAPPAGFPDLMRPGKDTSAGSSRLQSTRSVKLPPVSSSGTETAKHGKKQQ